MEMSNKRQNNYEIILKILTDVPIRYLTKQGGDIMRYLVTYIKNGLPKQKTVNNKFMLMLIRNKIAIKIINKDNYIIGSL